MTRSILVALVLAFAGCQSAEEACRASVDEQAEWNCAQCSGTSVCLSGTPQPDHSVCEVSPDDRSRLIDCDLRCKEDALAAGDDVCPGSGDTDWIGTWAACVDECAR